MSGSRPMSLRKETWRDRRWRWWFSGPYGWLWTCHICRLEASYPAVTLTAGYGDALDHLDDEHLAVSAGR